MIEGDPPAREDFASEVDDAEEHEHQAEDVVPQQERRQAAARDLRLPAPKGQWLPLPVWQASHCKLRRAC